MLKGNSARELARKSLNREKAAGEIKERHFSGRGKSWKQTKPRNTRRGRKEILIKEVLSLLRRLRRKRKRSKKLVASSRDCGRMVTLP